VPRYVDGFIAGTTDLCRRVATMPLRWTAPDRGTGEALAGLAARLRRLRTTAQQVRDRNAARVRSEPRTAMAGERQDS
jgi:hypothetical protein